jgi:hypothetical protein
MRFLYIEHDVQLTHVLEILVKSLDQCVDELQVRHLVHRGVVGDTDDEIQRRISTIYHLWNELMQKLMGNGRTLYSRYSRKEH